jgi:phosphate-selective porin OprO/OprP
MKSSWKLKCAVLLALCGNVAHADEATDERISKLQKMLEAQQLQMQLVSEELKALKQQHASAIAKPTNLNTDEQTQLRDQQWQMEAMADELKALQGARGKSEGQPVYATFKDGVKLQDGSGNWQLAINGRIQADYRQFDPDVDAADTFSLRRARLGGTMTFYKDYVARIEGEYAGSSTALTYGYFDINKFQSAKLRLGQFKPFYGLERSMSTNFTDFQERSMADALLGSTYDRGVMVYGSPIGGLNYSMAYINGSGTTDENNASNDNKDFTGRLTGNVAEFAGWKEAVLHLGAWWGYGREGSRRQSGYIPTMQSEARGAQFFSTTCAASACGSATANALNNNSERTRGGGELAVAYGPVKLQTEYIHSSFEADDLYERDLNAWYASAVWNVTGEPFAAMYKEGVFGRLKPINNFGANGWGALQLGLRYAEFDGSDFKTSNAAGSGVLLNTPAGTTDGVLVATNKADAWTLGANWILNPNTRILLNWIHTTYDTPITVRVNGRNSTFDDEDAVTMRAQFDF